jgi:hypothetical protein
MDQLPTAGSRKPSASSGQIALVIGLEIVGCLESGSTTSFFSCLGRACFRSRSPLSRLSLDLCLSNDNRPSSVLSLVPNEVYRSPFVQTWAAPCPCSTNSRTKTPESSRLSPGLYLLGSDWLSSVSPVPHGAIHSSHSDVSSFLSLFDESLTKTPESSWHLPGYAFEGRLIIERFPSTQRSGRFFRSDGGSFCSLFDESPAETPQSFGQPSALDLLDDELTIERSSSVVRSMELQCLGTSWTRIFYQPGFVCKLQRTELRSRDHRKCGAYT